MSDWNDSGMNTTKCEVLLKTLEFGNITRAAEALGYTQSAVSRAIAALEREWDQIGRAHV